MPHREIPSIQPTMRTYFFPVIVCTLAALVFFSPPAGIYQSGDTARIREEGRLRLPESNVAILAVHLPEAGLQFTRAADLPAIRRLHDELVLLPGVSSVESIISATRVIADDEDILVSRAIPEDPALINDEVLRSLAEEIGDFPELAPFISADLNTLLMYVTYPSRTPTIAVHRGLMALQEEWASSIPFSFTGRAPIIAETERLLTGDILVFLPLLLVMVVLVFAIFRSVRIVLTALALMTVSAGLAYGVVRFLGVPDSPLILLIPVFALGLLSDYLVHYFYHRLHHLPHPPGDGGGHGVRRVLLFPLSLTALSTVTGFLSLSLINGSGHVQIGLVVSGAVVLTWFGVFFWVDYQRFPRADRPVLPRFQDIQVRVFRVIARFRYLFLAAVLAGTIWGAVQMNNVAIEPYPVGQLPETTTIRRADATINRDFFGTMPFFLEVDTGTGRGLLNKEAMLALDDMHTAMRDNHVGHSFSVLTVLKRMNYYFMGDEESLLTSTEFDDFYDALIEQYLLYYSSSVDPVEYSALLDSSYRFFSIRGLLHYESYHDLERFLALLDVLRESAPHQWTISLHGMARELQLEHTRLRNNWLISFLAGGGMIFVTVLLFYRRAGLAIISLVPGVIAMVISFGIINTLGVAVDAFSIIFVAIVTGLVIDYSIHTLVALDQIPPVISVAEGFRSVIGYSGIPIFLSFMTSTISFSVLFLSAFRGARNLGFLLLTSLVLSFFLSLYLLPLIVLPYRLQKEARSEV